MAGKTYYEAGRYWGRVTRQHLGESSNGNPQLMLSFLVLGRVNLADPEGDLLTCGQQYERTVYRVITDRTLEYVVADMDALGWYGHKWAQFDEGDSQCVDVRGKELAFVCKHEPHYQTQEPREVWGIAQSSDGPPVKALDVKAVNKLEAMFGKALKGRKPAGNGEKPQEARPQRKPIGDLTRQEINAELGEVPADRIPF